VLKLLLIPLLLLLLLPQGWRLSACHCSVLNL
jgi:hypothetical protein